MTDRVEFALKTKLAALRRCKGRCDGCGYLFKPKEYEFDHRNPAAFCNGDVSLSNIAVLCLVCHSRKTKGDLKLIAKSNRVTAKHFGLSREGTVRGWRK